MRILIAGYYGFNNLGDEWSLEILIKALKQHTDQITILSNQVKETESLYQVKSISRWQPVAIIKALIQADLLLFGGGSLIQDLSSFKSPLYYLGLCGLAKLFGKKVIMVSQGMGPIKYKFNDLLCQIILPWLDRIMVRDHGSLLNFKQVGVDDNKLIEAADLVWLKEMNIKQPDQQKKWLIILRADQLTNQPPPWLEALHQQAKLNDQQLAFLAVGDQGDEELVKKLASDGRYDDCIFYAKQQWQEAYQAVDLVISMRYHGLLLGALANAMLIGIGQDPKIINLISDLHQVKATHDNLISTLWDNLNQLKSYQEAVYHHSQKMIKKSKLNQLNLQAILLKK